MGVALPSPAGSALPAGSCGALFGARSAAPARRIPAGHAEAGESADAATIRAFRTVGLASLFAIPLLLTLSFVSGIPVAVPAIIAIGYLAVAQALTRQNARRADNLALSLMGAFLAWTALACLSDGSGGGTATALLAPAFAAAPAFMRQMLARHDEPLAGHARAHAASLAACAPDEAVLLLSADATLLASTPAAGSLLGDLLPEAGSDLAAALTLADRAALLNALRHPAASGGATFDLHFSSEGRAGRRAFAASARLVEAGLVGLRLAAREDGTRREILSLPVSRQPISPAAEATGLDEALSFALRHVSSAMEIDCVIERGLEVASDRASLRRVLVRVLEAAMPGGGRAGEVRIEARPVRGAVLLRAEAPVAEHELPARDAERALAQLRGLVDAIGGTMIAERTGEVRGIALRLPLANETKATGTV